MRTSKVRSFYQVASQDGPRLHESGRPFSTGAAIDMPPARRSLGMFAIFQVTKQYHVDTMQTDLHGR
eukprot:3447706-Lingulodinium_polyedra.AAC.1